jgi:uridine kinase
MEAKAKIIGIGGVSCAGKSLLADKLSQRFRESGYRTCVLDQDDYVFPTAEIPLVRDHTDWECPESIDFKGFEEAIKDASASYDIVIAAGLMVFWEPGIRKTFDYLVFIKITREEFRRRKRKDLRWGREPEWYIDHIWDSYLEYGQFPYGIQPDLSIDAMEPVNTDQVYNTILPDLTD